MRLSNRQTGALLMTLSALSFTCMQLAVRLTSSELPLMEQIVLRNVFSLPLAWWMTRRHHVPLLGPLQHQPAMLARSLFGLAGAVAQFIASAAGAQANITVIIRMSPFITWAAAVLFLRERIVKDQVVALILAGFGAVVTASPLRDANLLPMAAAALCALFTGLVHPILSYLKGRVDGYSIVAHFSLVSVIGALPFLFIGGSFVVPRGRCLVFALLIGLFACLGQLTLTFSYRFSAASEISIYGFTAIPFSMLVGLVALGEPVTPQALFGGALVVAAALIVYRSGRRADLSGSAETPISPR